MNPSPTLAHFPTSPPSHLPTTLPFGHFPPYPLTSLLTHLPTTLSFHTSPPTHSFTSTFLVTSPHYPLTHLPLPTYLPPPLSPPLPPCPLTHCPLFPHFHMNLFSLTSSVQVKGRHFVRKVNHTGTSRQGRGGDDILIFI